MRSLVVLIPVLSRPHRVKPLVDSIRATAPHARILFLTSAGHQGEYEAIGQVGCEPLLVSPHKPGDYARKINAGYRATIEELIFLGADDLRFHPGWLEAAEAQLAPGVGVVGTQDLCNARVIRGEHSTHSLVTRAYADEFGTIDKLGEILHEGYAHEFVDDELIATAKARGAFAFAETSIVEHLHPMAGKAPLDAVYRGQRARMHQGRRHFEKRRHLWKA